METKQRNPSSFSLFLKRIFDVCFSLNVLLITFPLLVLIALAIKVTSPGPIFYKCKRAGKHFRPFNCYKFRTMCVDADRRLNEILSKDQHLKEEWNTYMKLKKDPRITLLGNFLRKTSLDEIPQFINVLKGDISVVGPRPYAIHEITDYLGIHTETILSIKPGITGLWQTSGRNNLTLKDRIKLDVSYTERESLFFDFFLILKTIPIVLFSRGAY